MITLGIESSCDETSVAIIEDGRKILANVIATQIPIHQKFGGVVPEIASRKHIINIMPVLDEALDKAQLKLKDIGQIAVAYGPGLVGALLVGVSAAKALAFSLGVPLLAVNHLEGHIFANFLSHRQLEPPFVSLVVSGGHTALVDMKGYNSFSMIGQTRDDAAGEAFDKVARLLGLPYPGGPQIDKLARQGNPEAIDFPRALMKDNNYEFSFSGLKSAVINYIHNAGQKNISINKADVAASFQKTVIDILVCKTIMAARSTGMKTIVLAGGVAANSQLEERLTEKCRQNDIDFYFPSKILCTDNAAMIACRGYYQSLTGKFADMNLNAVPYLELNDSYADDQ
ncbi:tRNA (adenosine(37)-N6)-threonylcarbamoyltransferase complex transferase subunit TsaD [Pectinatus haikarae]|uniref:tRNA N6-adenosine threonylcarbamoyltransferase n=1 Tax=Pectinatus haikarae TaxID=349096 RepID=A0ABT9YBA9_9FIRM|nr:tRNA (adenosine(37)-N6)-threonylcarbamoyltransferase complex transferase subunit TsaD [Pectinatus haikarae]MDQ0204928.1 N6-L-threonylcarbamoyladenine synthase [Pectinatus haikarae]